MDQKIPFTSYDFWAYLSAGFLFLAAIDFVAKTGFISQHEWSLVQGLIAISCAYTLGQLIASMSSVVFERILVGKILGSPRDTLFGRALASGWVKKCMPDYFRALPPETQKAVADRAAKAKINASGQAIFWIAYANARETPVTMARLETFQNLYGFCRNIAFVALMDSAIMYWGYRWNNGPESMLYFSWASTAVGVGMVFRYLKFYKHYTTELFTSYAHSKTSP